MKPITTLSLHSTSRSAWRGLFLCVAMLGASAAAPAAEGQPAADAAISAGGVQVSYQNPETFSEMRRYPNERARWLDELSRYLVRRASVVTATGERLTVTITDVQLAGMFEPWRRHLYDVRIVRDTTPPLIDLSFRLESPQGALIAQGERRLRDINFLTRNRRYSGDELAYEKNLLDDWVYKEFPAVRK